RRRLRRDQGVRPRPRRLDVHQPRDGAGTRIRPRSLRGPAPLGERPREHALVRAIDRMYLLWVVLTLAIPFAIGYAAGGTWQWGVEAMIWGGLIRIFCSQHATFSVNSICHMFGRQAYRSCDEARNNWFVAVLVFGEGW